MAVHNELGRLGEQMAIDFLIQKGFTIREQNWRFQKAEVDIIAQKGSLLAVIEVKTRSTRFFGDPQEFIKEQKIKLLTKAVDHYVYARDLEVEVRFDVIGIVKNRMETSIIHLEDAFYHF
jgi:putative endonuclease